MSEETAENPRCQSCGKENAAWSKFCYLCGFKLDSGLPSQLPLETAKLAVDILSTEQVSVSSIAAESGDKNCPFCAEPVHSDAIKCRHCQSNLTQRATSDVQEQAKRPTRNCPHCAEEILKEALKCKHCGSMVDEPLQGGRRRPSSVLVSHIDQAQLQAGQPLTVVISDRVVNPDVDPVLMTILSSCCLTGLGQIVMGQVAKGIVIFVVSVGFAACTAGISLFVTTPLIIIDTFCIASKLSSGRSVGKWECF